MVKKSVEGLLKYLQQRCQQEWLIGCDSRQLYQITEEFFAKFAQLSQQSTPSKILLVEEQPREFLAALLAGLAANCWIFLGNPHWQRQEWEQVFNLVHPDCILGKHLDIEMPTAKVKETPLLSQLSPLIMIPTGGSSGKIRFAIHNWQTLTASVEGFCQYFAVNTVNSFCILPLYHVSGLLQFLRSFLTGGKLVIFSYQSLKQGETSTINPQDFLISLVPTQLQFLLASNSHWLAKFQTVFLGGAPAWPSLLETARNYRLRLAPTYGLTETAAQIATLKPDDFLKGYSNSGKILPHAQVKILSDRRNLLTANEQGIIAIHADSLCFGYYPDIFVNQQYFITDDIGVVDEEGYLQVLGRNSHKIITGGENVFPAEVETAIIATQLVADVVVIGLPDSQWGEAVTALYVPRVADTPLVTIKRAIEQKISKIKQPKLWIKLEYLPRNTAGKLDYAQLKLIASQNQAES